MLSEGVLFVPKSAEPTENSTCTSLSHQELLWFLLDPEEQEACDSLLCKVGTSYWRDEE